MPYPKFFTSSLMVKLGDIFVEEFKENPKLPLSVAVVDRMIREHLKLNPPKGWKFNTHPDLKPTIDAKCRDKLGRLAPTLGARGRLEFRSKDGSYIGPHTTHVRKSRKEPPAPTLANLPEPNLGSTPYTSPMPSNGSNGHSKGGRIFWDSTARDLLHDGIMQVFAEHPEEGLSVDVLNKGMRLALPKESWRPIIGRGGLGESYPRAVRAVRELVRKALQPPPEPEQVTITREVELPVNLEELLESTPLSVLIGIVARREAELRFKETAARMESYGKPLPASPAPAKTIHTTHATIPPEALDVPELEKTMPQIQVIGFAPFQHRTMVERFKFIPVVLHPSIDPGAKPDKGLLAKGAIYIVNAESAPKGWRDLVQAVTEDHPNRRRCYTDREKVMDHVKGFGMEWAKEHGALFEAWKKTRPQ